LDLDADRALLAARGQPEPFVSSQAPVMLVASPIGDGLMRTCNSGRKVSRHDSLQHFDAQPGSGGQGFQPGVLGLEFLESLSGFGEGPEFDVVGYSLCADTLARWLAFVDG
jgi:hypothetical protein